MKFWIIKTSDDTSHKKPYKDAKLEKSMPKETNSLDNYYYSRNIYTIEIKDLDEFLAFISAVDYPAIISETSDCFRLKCGLEDIKYTIEIYDDYRE